jgi:hypothetical protein
MFNFLNPFYLVTATTFYGFFDFALPILGGTVGFALGGPLGAAAGIGLAGSLSGSSAAEDAAMAQKSAAERGLQFQMESRRMAVEAAEANPEELASIDALIQNREATLGRNGRLIAQQEQILNAVNPAIKEAGKQALQLLKGQEAESLSFVRDQRAKDRTKLEQTLQQRLGSGFETSTAGIAALSAFDDATSSRLFESQQTSLGNFLGVAQTASQTGVNAINSLSQTSLQSSIAPLQAQQNIAGRKVNAIAQTPVDFANVIQTAGADQVGDIQRAQTLEDLGNFGMKVGMMNAFKSGKVGGGSGQSGEGFLT